MCVPLPPPDHSLTPDNLLHATQNIPLWETGDSYTYLDIPRSQHDQIVAQYDGEEAKHKLFSTWLTHHPCPTWDDVTELLRRLERMERGRKGAAEEVEETYLKSELQ